MRQVIPLGRRPLDVALVLFFLVNLTFTTYVVSLEQVVISDPFHFTPPAWPPVSLLALVHWWERSGEGCEYTHEDLSDGGCEAIRPKIN